VDAYLTKPIQPQQLYETIERLATGVRLIDEAALLDGLGGDRQLLMKLINLFLADYPRTIGRISRALRDRRRIALREAAHALKGSVGNFGQSAAYETARELETQAKSRSWRGADAAFEALKKDMVGFRRSLEELRTNMRNSNPRHTVSAGRGGTVRQ
jgi:HPt (histidine-containing phosphotransfer) domain-containing protein